MRNGEIETQRETTPSSAHRGVGGWTLVNVTKNVASHLRKGVRILSFYDAL